MPQLFSLIVSQSIYKSLSKIPLPWRKRIMRAIDLLPQNPYLGEKLWGKLQGKRKIRVPPYRIIYELNKKSRRIIILEIGHRQGIYS
ncbi:MAG: type II toxin-antitoxin system RelE/ParE family toxin [Candidatus Pacebacteria bacterium]|nr:type II toxin-antitoxin system RelE/ParE family toxin [Candidatus Paceibacterota bacterium]